MKKLYNTLAVILFVLSCVLVGTVIGRTGRAYLEACGKNPFHRATENALVIFSKPIKSNSDFLFTGVNDEIFIVPLSVTPSPGTPNHPKNKIIWDGSTASVIGDFEIGNAFFVDISGHLVLYGANHCMKEIQQHTKRIGADISIIEYKQMIQENKARCLDMLSFTGYSLALNFADKDSFFIRGYFPDTKDQKVKSVLIKGIGTKVSKKEVFEAVPALKNHSESIQDKMLIFKVGDNFDLPGASGSPAFNSQNQVIGLYSGHFDLKDGRYGRVSLFN